MVRDEVVVEDADGVLGEQRAVHVHLDLVGARVERRLRPQDAGERHLRRQSRHRSMDEIERQMQRKMFSSLGILDEIDIF